MMLDGILFLFLFFGTACFYFGVASLVYYPLSIAYPLWERRLLARARAQRFTPSVSILVPAYNEATTIGISLRSVLASDYPDFEVIVIDDGSTDGTKEEVRPFLSDARVRYLYKENGGKASALNAGLAAARGEIVLFTDADSVFEADTIRQGVAYFIDPTVGAVSGNDTPLRPRGLLQKMLVVTSHIGTGFVRRALSLLGVLQIISGNLGLVRADILRRIGGFREIWGEDLEVTLRLQRERVRVVYGASTRVLAECPSTISGLWKQRVRWLRSYIKILRLHRDMVGSPRFGGFGPFLAFNAFNMIVIPVLQVLTLLMLPFVLAGGHFSLRGWEWVAYVGWGFLLAAAVISILLDKTPRDLLYLPYAALLVFFSHFYNAVALYSIWAELRGSEENWNKLERRDPRKPAGPAWRWGPVTAVAVVIVCFGIGYWFGTQPLPQAGQGANQTLVHPPAQIAVAIHFDAWRDWRDAYRRLLAAPESEYLNRVAVSAGRADWTYFRWPGHKTWWSPEQSRAETDMLERTLAVLAARGYRTTAILDVYATRYLARYPDEAAVDTQGRRSREVVCSTVLAIGDYGHHLVRVAEALAATTRADTVAITELFYDRHCFDDRCLLAFKKATGRRDWPRTLTGAIDLLDPELGAWRSRQVASVVARLARVVHAHGKRLAMDVKLSHGSLQRNSAENGQDYRLLAPWVDEFVVWDYFALESLAPETSANVAAYFNREFGARRYFLSLGLWDKSGDFISPESLARALRAAREGGAQLIWITPGQALTPGHWRVIAESARVADTSPSNP